MVVVLLVLVVVGSSVVVVDSSVVSRVHMLPLYTVAASFVPSAEEVIPCQLFVPSPTTRSVQGTLAEPRSAITSKIRSTGMIILEMVLGGEPGGGVLLLAML